MADETPQLAPPQTTHKPPSTAEETETTPQPQPQPEPQQELESASVTENDQPLASVELPPTEPLLPVEEQLKEAVTVVEKETPLTPPLPEQSLTAEHVSVTTAAAPTPPISQPLASVLGTPQKSESPEPPKEEASEKLKKKAPESLVSFKEESNQLSDLSDSERRALEEFKNLVQEALNNRLFSSASPSETSNSPEEVSIWAGADPGNCFSVGDIEKMYKK